MDAPADPQTKRVDNENEIEREARRIDEALGAEVKGWRNKRSMSQDKLVEKTGISKSTLGRLERGERPMTMGQLYRICRALRCKPSDLINAAEIEVGIEPLP